MSVSVEEGMQQQLFGLTGGILHLNEHLTVNYLGQDYALDCRGHCSFGMWVPGPWLRICAAYVSPGAGTAQSSTRIVTEAVNTARGCVCLCRVFTARPGWGREPNLSSQRYLWQDGFAHPLLAQNGLRGTITSFSDNFRVFCAHRISHNRYSKTLIRISF